MSRTAQFASRLRRALGAVLLVGFGAAWLGLAPPVTASAAPPPSPAVAPRAPAPPVHARHRHHRAWPSARRAPVAEAPAVSAPPPASPAPAPARRLRTRSS